MNEHTLASAEKSRPYRTAARFGQSEIARVNRRRTRLTLAYGSLSHVTKHLSLLDCVVKRVVSVRR